MCESLHDNSALPPHTPKHNSHIPMTLHNYITHPNGAGPVGHRAQRGAPPGQEKSQLVVDKIFSCNIFSCSVM